MLFYKPKVMHNEEYTLDLYPMRQNRNAYPIEWNTCGYDFSMFIPDDGPLCDTVNYDNIDLIRNSIIETIYLVLSSLKIGGT